MFSFNKLQSIHYLPLWNRRCIALKSIVGIKFALHGFNNLKIVFARKYIFLYRINQHSTNKKIKKTKQIAKFSNTTEEKSRKKSSFQLADKIKHLQLQFTCVQMKFKTVKCFSSSSSTGSKTCGCKKVCQPEKNYLC